MAILSGLKTLLRVLSSPEAPWRLPNPATLTILSEMTRLLCIPLYQTSASDRVLIAKFYASHPESAAFIIHRIVMECGVAFSADSANLETSKIVKRIFGAEGEAALLHALAELSASHPVIAKSVEADSLVLIEASKVDKGAVNKLRNLAEAKACGERVGVRFPHIDVSDPDTAAYIGAHWLYCGELFFSQYEVWLANEKLQEATRRTLDKLGL